MHKNLADLHQHMKQHIKTHAHLWKKTAIIAFLLLQATSFLINGNGFSWSYPLKEVSKDSTCRKTARENLSEDCKQPLPIIKGAKYENYKDNPAYTTIYTTMWGAPYDNGWAIGKGAHEGVDIVSSKGTPVYAVEDGTVIRARSQAGYGKVVMIKHMLADKRPVYSIYGHLDAITIPEGVTVKEGELIGTVGNEGFSFGNHLLWNIHISPTNTYAFWGCPEYGNGTTFNIIANIVNNGLCRSYLLERTADPIAWIESQGGTISLNSTSPSINTTVATTTTTTRKRMPIIALAPSAEVAAATSSTTIQKSLATRIVTTNEIPKNSVALATPTTTKTTTEKGATLELANTSALGESFLEKYTISLVPSFSNNLQVGQTTSLIIKITDKDGKPFVGKLPKDITLIPSENIISLSPQVIRLTNNDGKAIILISADQAGTTSLVASYNMKTISKMNITVK